jgi:hypothetical protein
MTFLAISENRENGSLCDPCEYTVIPLFCSLVVQNWKKIRIKIKITQEATLVPVAVTLFTSTIRHFNYKLQIGFSVQLLTLFCFYLDLN